MTHDLLKEILKSLDITVPKIEITNLEDNVYYAVIHLVSGNNHYTVDARPSDAIAVALRTNSPIFVEKKVLEKSRYIDSSRHEDKDRDRQTEWLEMLENLSSKNFGKYKM